MTEVEIARLVEGSEAFSYALLLEGAPVSSRESVGFEVKRIGSAYAFLAPGVQHSLLLNRVIGLGVWEELDTSLVSQIDDLYRTRGVTAYAAEVAPSGVMGLGIQDLISRGFVPFKQTTMMFRGVEDVPFVTSTLAVRSVGPEFAQRFSDLCCGVFGFDSPFPEALRQSFQLPSFGHWMAFDGETPVAAAVTAYRDEGVAWIGWVCTLPTHRGRGAQALLAAAQLRECASRGMKRVTLEAATGTKRRPSQSLSNYKRLGWVQAYDRMVLVRRLAPGDQPTT
jgi:GNAT superfamily N-acetyltransferase